MRAVPPRFDLLIVGSGIAGLFAALSAARPSELHVVHRPGKPPTLEQWT